MYDKLTENDIKKMQEEIDYRKLVVRPKELEAVKEARAQGDLSENFEYKAAKQDKNRNESRIRYLEKMIKTAHVISDTSKDDEVGINNTVQVYIEEDDETETYKLVTTVRGNSLKGYVSIDSPLGKAILGHKVGDRVTVKVSDAYSYDLIRIRGNREVQIIGPASEAVSKINDLYRMAVYVRAPQEEVLAELREKLERYIEINKGFRTVYLQFDFSRKY